MAVAAEKGADGHQLDDVAFDPRREGAASAARRRRGSLSPPARALRPRSRLGDLEDDLRRCQADVALHPLLGATALLRPRAHALQAREPTESRTLDPGFAARARSLGAHPAAARSSMTSPAGSNAEFVEDGNRDRRLQRRPPRPRPHSDAHRGAGRFRPQLPGPAIRSTRSAGSARVAAVGFGNQVPRTLADAAALRGAEGGDYPVHAEDVKAGERSSWWASSTSRCGRFSRQSSSPEIAWSVFVVRVRQFQDIAESHTERPVSPVLSLLGPSWVWERLAWSDAMLQKYEYAAAHPWLPVSPDPPEPADVRATPRPDGPGSSATASAPSDVDDPSQPLPPLPRDL